MGLSVLSLGLSVAIAGCGGGNNGGLLSPNPTATPTAGNTTSGNTTLDNVTAGGTTGSTPFLP